MLKYGMFLFIPAVFFFARGLNRKNDYLRFGHGLWHLLCGFAFYYFY